jgi:class 3 adenylate cyclase
MKRKIAAILAAEAPNYARNITTHAAATLPQLVLARRVFEEQISAHDGRIFNTAGASILAEFSSSVEAVRCALAVQQRLLAQLTRTPTDHPLVFRIGLTIGDIVDHEGDLLGDGVNVAARLAVLADDGGVCVSHTVYEQVRTKVDIRVVDLGPQTLKNMPDTVHALTVHVGDGGARQALVRSGSERGVQPTNGTTPPWAWLGLLGSAALAAAIGWQTLVASNDKQGITQAAPPPATSVTASPRPPQAADTRVEPDRAGKSQRCGEILERIQAGSATTDDRSTLQKFCS